MNRWKLLISAFLLLALLSVISAKTVRTLASSPVHCNGWSVIKSPNPNPIFDLLNSVAAISSKDTWAVGYTDNKNSFIKTLIEHWDGSQWNSVSSPNPGKGHDTLNAVAAISPNDVWAVGDFSQGQAGVQTLIEHWNGSHWNVVPSPSPGYVGDSLQGITAISASDIWAVGYEVIGFFENQTLIEHWNGKQWSVVPSPSPIPGGNNVLQGVAAISANDVWAIGSYIDNNSLIEHTIAEHWNGATWKLVPSANPNLTLDTFQAVSALATNDVWAVGIAGKAGLGGLIEHWNGSKWNVIHDPNIATTWLNGVAAISPNNVWIIGLENVRTHIEHWDGTSWKVAPSPNPGSYSDVLRSIANVPGSSSLWTVGNFASQGSRNSDTLTLFHC